VSCELAVRDEQVPSDAGRFEIMSHCNDEAYAQRLLTRVGELSFDAELGHHHTIELWGEEESDSALRGVLLELAHRVTVGGEPFAILRCVGVTQPELVFAREPGVPALIALLVAAGVYPRTDPTRASVLPRTEG
jgi:hypothetical protein